VRVDAAELNEDWLRAEEKKHSRTKKSYSTVHVLQNEE